MKITWFGQACFLISAEHISVVTDPYNSKIGFKLPEHLHADVVTVSHQHMDHNNTADVKGNPVIIPENPAVGMADEVPVVVKGVQFFGINSFHDAEGGTERGANIIFKFAIDGVTIAHLGDLGHLLTDAQVAELQGTDVLMLPIGGRFTIGAEVAAKVIEQVRPRIIIPMHYGVKGLSFPLDPVSFFLKKIPIPSVVADFFEITKETLPGRAKVVVLNRTHAGKFHMEKRFD